MDEVQWLKVGRGTVIKSWMRYSKWWKSWMRYGNWKLDEVQRSKAGWGTVIDWKAGWGTAVKSWMKYSDQKLDEVQQWKAGWGAVTSKPDSQRQQHQAQSELLVVPSVPTPGPLSPVTPRTTTIQVNLNIYVQHFFLHAVFYTRTLQRTTFLNLSPTEVFTSIAIFFAKKSLERRLR